ncbi:helix-turn-helix transcriptional regulator [Methanococcoides alaskense]|uniref:Transcriptional regulator n=1 Tax=Methanococcoides alaskense TaxID=325778 RepID=A0AA90U1T9_9EURY|nr:winged helix-turn-helix domain-containing protein [Methanococcoides alaskense]MDA0525520.1 winged helix-turn-helix domain-containing protein [Methanococcoides alaskense]MDR6223900.1 putative transcriptional regulator [Methanococcoides alaskense]
MNSSLTDNIWLSEKRTNLLLLLMEGPRDIEQIKVSLNVTSRGMMPQIKKLKEKGLIVEEDETYRLSNTGRLIVRNMLPLINTLRMINENRSYWEQHDINILPPHLFRGLHNLGNYLLLEPDLNYTFEIPKEFTENLLRSKEIMSIISFFRPEYPKFYSQLAEKADSLTLLLSRSVFKRMEKNCASELEFLLSSESTRLYLYEGEGRPPAIDVSDWFMYVSFFNEQGRYDHRDIMSFDETALKWGKELFQYYCDRSTEITEI